MGLSVNIYFVSKFQWKAMVRKSSEDLLTEVAVTSMVVLETKLALDNAEMEAKVENCSLENNFSILM